MSTDKPLLRGRFLDESEVNYLRYGLRLDRDPTTIKRALQSLCEHHESGRRLDETHEIRQLIHSHLWSDVTVLRRWSMKALGLIGHPEDTRRLIDRLRVEADIEAQTWGIAALLGNERHRSLKEICEEAGLDKNTALILAARLYAPKSWINDHSEEVRVSLHDDELTLKWAVFLIGYGKAPLELFDPRHSNEIFLGELNAHSSSDISEYSMWALWERPDYDARYLKVSLDEARRHPENARKWLYRLATQSPEIVNLDIEALSDLSRDSSVPAREGLALGTSDLSAERFGRAVMDWYTREPNTGVRDILLTSMATQSRNNEDYRGLVASRFDKEQPDSPLRRRLLAASIGTPLYPDLKKITMRDEAVKFGLLNSNGTSQFIFGDYNMNGSTFNAGRDINANNLVGGDMIASANNAVQNMDQRDSNARELLLQVMEMLRETHGAETAKTEVARAAEAMAKAPSEKTKKGLIAKITEYGKNAAALGAAVGGIDKLLAALGQLQF